jgi:hypothetical protein
LVKHTLTTDAEALENHPDILHKIETDQLLDTDEYVFFGVKYVENCLEKATTITQQTIPEALAENTLSHPTLLTRNNALAMDMIMSEGLTPEHAIALSRTTADADTDIISLTQQHTYNTDLRTIKDLIERNAPNLRFNDQEISPHIRAVLSDSTLENASLTEIETAFNESLSPAELENIPKPKTLTQTAHLLQNIHIGDTAIVNYNAEFILETSGSTVPPFRCSLFIQRFSPDFYTIYDPLIARAALTTDPVSFIENSNLATELHNIILKNQQSTFERFANQLRTTREEAFSLSVTDMQNTYYIATYDYPKDILFTDFNIITHSPPPTP